MIDDVFGFWLNSSLYLGLKEFSAYNNVDMLLYVLYNKLMSVSSYECSGYSGSALDCRSTD